MSFGNGYARTMKVAGLFRRIDNMMNARYLKDDLNALGHRVFDARIEWSGLQDLPDDVAESAREYLSTLDDEYYALSRTVDQALDDGHNAKRVLQGAVPGLAVGAGVGYAAGSE